MIQLREIPAGMSRTPARLRSSGDGPEREELAMKYLFMIYGNQEKWSSIPAEDFPAEIAKQDAFNQKYAATGELLGAFGLAAPAAARLITRKDGQPVVSDGPYLETKEYMASFYLFDVESEERAY